MIYLKRVYEPKEEKDGIRILVDRLWPRGVKKESIDIWLKDVAPSEELRKDYHQSKDFEAFKKKYIEELKSKNLEELINLAKSKDITLVYASKDKDNNAYVLKEYLDWILERQR